MRPDIRRFIRYHPALYRLAIRLRAWVRTWILPPLRPEVRAEIGRYPALQRFVKRARRKCTRATAFADLLATPFLTEYLNHELARLALGEPSTQRVTGYLQGFTIVQTPEFALRVRFPDDRKATDIYSIQRDTLLAPLGCGIEIRRYRVPEAARRSIFEKTARLSENGTVLLQPGEMATFNSGSEAYVAVPQSPQGALLVLEDHAIEPLSWRFDAETLLCTGAISSDPAVSRLRETLELAVALQLRHLAGPLRSLWDHPVHLVRWSALAAITRLSRNDALPVLRRAVRDRHPQLRRAAQRLLEQEFRHGANP